MNAHTHNEAEGLGPRPYANPYVAGLFLGLVLLSAFVIMGRGLGASGAMSSLVAVTVNAVAPGHAAGNEFYQGYLDTPSHPLKSFLVFEVLGVFVGGLLSGAIARRIKKTVEKGPRITTGSRLAFSGPTMASSSPKASSDIPTGIGGGASACASSFTSSLLMPDLLFII